MNKLGGLKSHGGIDPMGGVLRDKPDHSAGVADMGPMGRSVPVAKCGHKGSMIDGPYGGKVKA